MWQSATTKHNPCWSAQSRWHYHDAEKLTELFQLMWNVGKAPQKFKDASIVQRKGNHHSCDTHLGISPLSLASKILDRILLNRLIQNLAQCLLQESEYGFRSERGTAKMIFAARQLQEKKPRTIATSLWPSLTWLRPLIRWAETAWRR